MARINGTLPGNSKGRVHSLTAIERTSLSIRLDDGAAHLMGDGLVVVMQRDPNAKRNKMQNVVLTLRDLQMLAVDESGFDVGLEDGHAFKMGEGLFIVTQRDRATRGAPVQNIVLSANDTAAMLAAA